MNARKKLPLTENEVVEAVAAHLVASGYRIESALTTNEQGIDIQAVRWDNGRRLLVEAKGGTNSKRGTVRYGLGFTPNQAKNHVAVALYCAARLHETAETENADIALAFPDDSVHRKLVKNIGRALSAMKVLVFFVSADAAVCVLDSH